VRSTAQSIEYFIESSGAALAPVMAGYLADRYNLSSAILWICIGAWTLDQPWLYSLAAISGIVGVFIGRWLFFAEAKHVVGLYY
jgi:DMSO reductase anchor subunit